MKKIAKTLAVSAFAFAAVVSATAPVSASSAVSFNTGALPAFDLSSMDVETALMMVQQQRAQLLDQQLADQANAVQERNAQLAILSSQLKQAEANGDAATAAQRQSEIDALSNSQQIDMLRLQSLSNKRNEAFDVMTNFVKKMQDSRSSIIGNMR
ncbi:hypothetical protein [Saccharibacillus sp. O23]|uniref:hypothetical protein n=1 Tax=Saccharibacillus sp. O23 TaxID=2009338 RepID=UPI001C52D6E9|nr:hypothetical protein [Saccharibacillus sp. O23]